jgi:hypothetical protein
VSRRELAKRGAIGAGSLVCLLLAVTFALLAADVVRWQDAVRSGDVRYRLTPGQEGLWDAEELGPFGIAKRALGLEDDVEFRHALRALRVAHIEQLIVSDPKDALLRNEAQARLEAIAVGDSDPAVRSRAAALLGVLWLSRLVTETEERSALLSSTVANLQLAISLDPTNEEAKYNLELATQRSRGLQITEASGGLNPTPGGSGSKGAGAGQPGSGY